MILSGTLIALKEDVAKGTVLIGTHIPYTQKFSANQPMHVIGEIFHRQKFTPIENFVTSGRVTCAIGEIKIGEIFHAIQNTSHW